MIKERPKVRTGAFDLEEAHQDSNYTANPEYNIGQCDPASDAVMQQSLPDMISYSVLTITRLALLLHLFERIN